MTGVAGRIDRLPPFEVNSQGLFPDRLRHQLTDIAISGKLNMVQQSWGINAMSIRKPSLAILLAANYLLVVVSAPLLHNHPLSWGKTHGSRGPARAEARLPCSCHHHGIQGRPHPTESPGEKAPAHCPSPHRDCPICQFLADSPIQPEDVPEEQWTALEFALPPLAPACPAVHVGHTWQSRAPPAVV